MGKAEEIIRRYAEAKEPVEGFGSWLLADRDSAEKEGALSGLWNRLEATPAADDAFLRRAKLSSLMRCLPVERPATGSWIRRYGWIPLSAAAALALLLVLHRPASVPEAEPSSSELAQAQDPVIEVSEESAPLLAEAVEVVDLQAAPGRSVRHNSSSVTPAPALPEGGESASGEEVGIESASEPASEPAKATEGIASDRPDTEGKVAISEDSGADKAAAARQWEELERRELSGRGKKTTSPMIGLQASGGLLTAASSRSFSQVGYIPGGEVSGNYFGYSSGVAKGLSTHYDIPVKAVLSLYWPINDKLYLGAGLGVTSLHSRTTGSLNGTANAYETRAIYAGIPLSLRYNFVSWGRSHLYGAVGVSADYLVKAWTMPSTPTSVSPTVYDGHPLQFSTRLAAGYEYRVFNTWSLFGESSLDYYFKDNSSLDTYFKQHPLSPSVSLGMHYTFPSWLRKTKMNFYE